MADHSKLCDLAQYEIEDLQAAGITPSPAEIVKLNALAWAVRSTANEMTLAKGNPVTCGNVLLWPLTIEAGDWYNRIGCAIKGKAVEALAYAMAHCYSDGEPFTITDPRKAVSRWYRTVKATPAMVSVALDSVLSQMESPDMPTRLEDHQPSIGELAAKLAAETGIKPDYWERQCSIKYAVRILHIAMKRKSDTGRPLESDPVIQAQIALGYAVEKIRKAHEVK